MEKITAVGLCTTILLFGLLSFVLAFLAEVENIKIAYNDHECEKYKMKAFKLGIASTATILCTQLYVVYVFAGCCQCKELGLDVNVLVRLLHTSTWIVASVDFGLMMDASLKVKYRLEDKSRGQNICDYKHKNFDVTKPFPILGLVSLVSALMNIISFALIYKWTRQPIPERNTLINFVPNILYMEVKETMLVEHDEMEMNMGMGDGGTVVNTTRRFRAAVYFERTVEIFVSRGEDQRRIVAAPPSPSHARNKTKRIVHCTVLLLLSVGAATLAFLAEVKNIKHSYLHGDCIEMKTAAYKLAFASAALLLVSLLYFLIIMGTDGLFHYNDLSKLLYFLSFVLSLTAIGILAFTSVTIKNDLGDTTKPLSELCPVNKGHTLRLRFGFSVSGLLILVSFVLEIMTYNYVQVHPGS